MNIIGKAMKKPKANRSSENHGMVRAHYLLFWALVLLFGQLDANAQKWDLDDISIPIHGPNPAIPTGSTVYGISHESPDRKYLVYPYYIDGAAAGKHDAIPVRAQLIIVNRETGERWVADTVTVNNHNGANHIWLDNSRIAYHKSHLWTFSIYDLNTRLIVVDNIYGQLPHFSDGKVIYYTIQNHEIRTPGTPARPAQDQGLWKYDIAAGTETQLVSLQDVIRHITSNPNFNLGNDVRNVNHAEPSPTGDKVTFVVNQDGPKQLLVDPDGSILSVMSQKPFHALWMDEKSMLSGGAKIRRRDLDGSEVEVLGGIGPHAGFSTDHQWVGGERSRGGYEEDSDGKTRAALYKKGQVIPVAILGAWGSEVTWDGAAHVNPAFTNDGNRFYYLKGHQDDGDLSYFALNYVNLESYKKTITRYCAAGEPYATHRDVQDDRYIKSVSITKADGGNQKVLIPKLSRGLNEFPEHGYQYLYYLPHSENAVSPGNTVTVDISANDESTSSVIKGYVDWNQDFDFGDTGETVFTQGTEDQENPGNTSFTKTFTVPSDALAGDTLMRIRFHDATLNDPGSCGSNQRTTTYDVPIKVAHTGSNACVAAGLIEASDVRGTSAAVYAFDDDDTTPWTGNRNGAGVWVKKCFSTPENLGGLELDLWGNGRAYRFDVELLDADNHLWVKALENQSSTGDTGFNTEKYYFPEEATMVSAAALRYIGYGSDESAWSSVAEITLLSSTSGSPTSATLEEDAFVAIGNCGNYGSDNRLVVQRYEELGGNGETVEFRNDSYLKFGLGNLPASVARATLRLKVEKVPGGYSHNSLHLVTGNSWAEDSITGRNLPGIGSLINAFPTPGKDQWLEVDVTSEVNAAKTAGSSYLSLRLSSSREHKHGVWYYSSEASDPRNRPQLTYMKGETG